MNSDGKSDRVLINYGSNESLPYILVSTTTYTRLLKLSYFENFSTTNFILNIDRLDRLFISV